MDAKKTAARATGRHLLRREFKEKTVSKQHLHHSKMFRLRQVGAVAFVRSFSSTASNRAKFELFRTDAQVTTTFRGVFTKDAVAIHRETSDRQKSSVLLPPPYVARFIGVLEGSIENCHIATKTSSATFSPAGGYKFLLKAEAPRGQGTTTSTEWTWELTPGEAVLLHRFLVQSLHYMSGFGFLSVQ